jgi:hypothetical protein
MRRTRRALECAARDVCTVTYHPIARGVRVVTTNV